MKKIIKNPIFTFILGAIIFGSIGSVVAYNYNAKDIGYTPSDNTWEVNNVGDALKDLKDQKDENKTYSFIDKGIEEFQGSRIQNKTLTKTIDKGKYIVATADSFAFGSVTGTTYKGNGYNKMECNKDCDIEILNNQYLETYKSTSADMLEMRLFYINIKEDLTTITFTGQVNPSRSDYAHNMLLFVQKIK